MTNTHNERICDICFLPESNLRLAALEGGAGRTEVEVCKSCEEKIAADNARLSAVHEAVCVR